MKPTELIAESPYLHYGEFGMPTAFKDTFSKDTISRDFKKIGEHGVYSILLENNLCRVVLIDIAKTNQRGRHEIEFVLAFKDEKPVIPGVSGTCLQIDQVFLNQKSRNQNITSKIYKLMMELGYNIVSDTTQFEPAKALWKSLAKNSDNSYSVVVADLEHGLFKDMDGQVIHYDGENIADHEIWTTGSDFNGYYRVLVLIPT